MKKLTLLAAVAVAGLLSYSAQAVPTSYSSINVQATASFQTNNTTSGSTTKFNVLTVKITNKELLKLIAAEYVTNFPSGFPTGASLVLDGFFDGSFSVLDKNGNVLLANAGVSAGNDDYQLYVDYDNYVYTGGEISSKSVYNYSAIGYLYFENAADTFDFELYGLANVQQLYNGSYSESFKFSGSDDAYLNGSYGVSTGVVTGSGKNIND